MTEHILLIDDDKLLCNSLTFNLERAGYRVTTAASAETALALAPHGSPNLILLDIELPGMNGLTALHHFQDCLNVPVIFLTGHQRELDQVMGLTLGADDYVTKPFDLDILLARIKAVLRRSRYSSLPSPAAGPLVVGDLMIDPAAHIVTVNGQPVELPLRQFNLLHTLALEAGRVVSADDLLDRVWGAGYMGESQIVYVHIHWLREKLEEDPNHPRRIMTVRGIGYKLEPQEA